MAGKDPTGNFNASVFRTAIQSVMEMALPNDVADQPTFRWLDKPTYSHADASGYPYQWAQAPLNDSPISDYQVVCVADISGSPTSSIGSDAGEFTELTARITMLDTQWNELIAHGNGRPPDVVLLGQEEYNVDYTPPNIALFDVDVYVLTCTGRDAGYAG